MCPSFPILWPCSAHPILGGGDPLGLSLLSSLARPPCFRSPPQAPQLRGACLPLPNSPRVPRHLRPGPSPPRSPPQPHSACSLCLGPPSDTTLPIHSLLPGAPASPPPPLPRGCTGVIICLCRHGLLSVRPWCVPGVPHIPGKEQMDPGSLLLGPGVHPEEGSISTCCPCERGWGWGAAYQRHSLGRAVQMLLMGWGRHVAPRGPTGS